MMKSVKSERVPSLKKYTALPLLLSADRDEDLVRLDYFVKKSYQLAKKARFARVRAARGWNPPYQGSCIDPRDQSHPLDPT